LVSSVADTPYDGHLEKGKQIFCFLALKVVVPFTFGLGKVGCFPGLMRRIEYFDYKDNDSNSSDKECRND